MHADIRKGSVARGPQSLRRQWDGQNRRCLVISVAVSSEPEDLKLIFLCSVTKCFIGDPKTAWPWVTLRCHFMLKSVFIVGLTIYLAVANNYVKMNKDTPILSATEMFVGDSSFWWYKLSVIFATIVAWEGANWVVGSDQFSIPLVALSSEPLRISPKLP